jgi:glycosyltransferase involved in cell wall biosynthesis
MTKVLIGYPTGEFARWADFYDYFHALDKPEGSLIMPSHGQSPASNRNKMIRAAIEHNCSHVFFLDDDMVFEPDVLKKLLAHDKDIVTGLYLLRTYPHYPVIHDEAYDDGKCRFMLLQKNKTGLQKVVNCGLGICLIKTEVFKKMEEPWITLGEIDKDEWCDDISFFNRARNSGFDLYCDFNVKAGHMSGITIWPALTNGVWNTEYRTKTGQTFQFPQLTEYPSSVREKQTA